MGNVRAEATTALGFPAWINPAIAKRAAPDPDPITKDIKLPFYKRSWVRDAEEHREGEEVETEREVCTKLAVGQKLKRT